MSRGVILISVCDLYNFGIVKAHAAVFAAESLLPSV